ncbi:hypothetical protein PoB_000326900 [Plakobranchus ocellatus]|uniref:Uncharacterized protein n=1 Tax=Plakobranchus ocellatus TaxID=259542 RepID=A0AAV3Y3U9_9GAST|nr:hypothetical protein PoB_000326900 [Plakobranchus ocellatus]
MFQIDLTTPEIEAVVRYLDQNKSIVNQALEVDQDIPAVETHNLGPKSTICQFWSTKLWTKQALFVAPTARLNSPLFNLFNALFKLFTDDNADSRDFKQNIRSYNSIFAFASLGVNEDVLAAEVAKT